MLDMRFLISALLTLTIAGCSNDRSKHSASTSIKAELTMLPSAYGDVGYRPSASFSPGGTLLCYVGRPNESAESDLALHGVTTEDPTASVFEFKLNGRDTRPVDICFNSNSSVLAALADDVVQVWDLNQKRKLCQFTAYSERNEKQRYIAINPSGSIVVTSFWKEFFPRGSQPYREPGLWAFDSTSGEEIVFMERSDDGSYYKHIAFHPSQDLLFGTVRDEEDANDYYPCIWDVSTGKIKNIGKTIGPITETTAYAFSAASDHQAIACWKYAGRQKGEELESQNIVTISPIGNFEPSLQLKHTDYVFWMAFSNTGELLTTIDKNSVVRVWSIPSGDLLHQMDIPGASEVAWDPRNRLLVLGNSQSKKHVVELIEINMSAERTE